MSVKILDLPFFLPLDVFLLGGAFGYCIITSGYKTGADDCKFSIKTCDGSSVEFLYALSDSLFGTIASKVVFTIE